MPPATTHRAEIQEFIRDGIDTALQAQISRRHGDMMDDSDPTYTTENELRFVALESGLSELKQQNGQFRQWFQQTGDRLQQTEATMQEVQSTVLGHAGPLQGFTTVVSNSEKPIGEIHNTLNMHQQELHSMGSNLQTTMKTMSDEFSNEMMKSFNQQYGRLEALLEKRHKTN